MAPVSLLALVRGFEELDRVCAHRHGDDEVVFVATSSRGVLSARRESIGAAPIEEFGDFADTPEIMEAAFHLSRDWWRAQGLEDIAPSMENHRGVELWQILELHLYRALSEAVYAVYLAERMIEALDPDELLVCDRQPPAGDWWIGPGLDLRGEAAALVAARHHIPVTILPTASSIIRRPHPRAAAGRLLRGTQRTAARTARTIATRAQPADILVHAEDRTLIPLLPVLRALRLQPTLTTAAIADDLNPHGIASVREIGLPILQTSGLRTRSRFRLPAVGEQLHHLRFRGYDISPLVAFQFDWLLRHGVGEVDRRLIAAEKTLEAVRPQLLVLTSDTTVRSLCWILPARQRGVTTVAQMHGALYTRPRPFRWARGGAADVTATWGALNREWQATALQQPLERFVPVGYPQFDVLRARVEELDRSMLRRRLGVVADETLVLFLVTMPGGVLAPHFGSEVRIYEAFFTAAARSGVAAVVVRSHPARSPSPEHVAAIADGLGIRVHVNPPSDLAETVVAADVVVGQPTTAMIESMLLGRPTILFGAHAADEVLWWTERATLPFARDGKQLGRLLQDLRQDPSKRDEMLALQEQFLEVAAGAVDGHAADRTVDLLRSLLRTAHAEDAR